MGRRIPSCENDAEGFTPVRRRLSTISTRQPHNESEKEWTAARCNRLLRVLKSRVAILNKDLSRIQSGSQGGGTTAEVKRGATRKADQDTDWTQTRKRIKRTYSTRDGRSSNDAWSASHGIRTLLASKETRSFIPGEISVPTPILNRARADIVSAISSAVPPLEIDGQNFRPNKRTKAKDGQSSSQLSETLRDIRKQTPASRYTIYEGIYNGLEALLKATIPEEPQNKQGGPKSLLSLCLDTVPRYIAQEEELFVAHMEETGSKSAINSRDISTEIYDDLEAFGSNGRGWKRLKNIVRSHGIQVVSDAIRAGSLDAEFIGILITLCIHTKAMEAAETLLCSLLSSVTFPGPKSVFTRFGDEPTTRPLSMLWKFVEITGSFSFQYRQLSKLISNGLLPLSWLATKEFSPVWTRAIQALSPRSNNADVLMFMDTVVPLLAQSCELAWDENHGAKGDGVMLEALKRTFSSLLTTFCSIVILSEGTTKQTRAQIFNASTSEYEPLVALMRSWLIQWELSHAFNIQGTLLVITNLILQEVGHNSPGLEIDLVDILLNHLRQMGKSLHIPPSYHEVVTFICSIARCCGRGALNSGFEYLENLHQTLESFICDRDSGRGDIVREIVADSALAFAQQVPDRKHLDYAATMEGRVHCIKTKPRVSLTPGHSLDSSRIGFRWEEGISEWVTATPLASTSKCQDLRTFPQTGLSECETPFGLGVRRKFDKQAPLHTRACVLQSSESIATANFSAGRSESSPISETFPPGLDEDSEDEVVNIISLEDEPIDYDDSDDDLINDDALEIESPNGFDTSGDELVSDPIEENPSDDGSEDELRPNSPQSDSSNRSEQSQACSPQSEGSLMDESFTSASSADFFQSNKPRSGRHYIDRVPRLSRRVLRRSLQWQLFDESDDELSFISVSSGGESILQDVTNSAAPSTRRLRQTKVAPKRKFLGGFGDSLLGESEDELCI